jgi:hypothetical protein
LADFKIGKSSRDEMVWVVWEIVSEGLMRIIGPNVGAYDSLLEVKACPEISVGTNGIADSPR